MRLTVILLSLATVIVADQAQLIPKCACPAIPDTEQRFDPYDPPKFLCLYTRNEEFLAICGYDSVCQTMSNTHHNFLNCPDARRVPEGVR